MKSPRKDANAADSADVEVDAVLERFEAIGKEVRSKVSAVREEIQTEQGRLESLYRAPAAEQEIDTRIDKLIADGASSVRRGNFFSMLAAREGSYSDNDLSVGLDRVSAFDLLATIAPDVLRAGLKQEAARHVAIVGVPARSSKEFADQVAAVNARILGLMAREEAFCRTLDKAGIRVDRRIETPQRIRDASADELKRIAGEAK